VIVTVAAEREGSLLTIRHEGWPRRDAIERHRGGWVGALDNLAALLEGESS
jgi:uncharacterized protein YndB with AHSA1/START domain